MHIKSKGSCVCTNILGCLFWSENTICIALVVILLFSVAIDLWLWKWNTQFVLFCFVFFLGGGRVGGGGDKIMQSTFMSLVHRSKISVCVIICILLFLFLNSINLLSSFETIFVVVVTSGFAEYFSNCKKKLRVNIYSTVTGLQGCHYRLT